MGIKIYGLPTCSRCTTAKMMLEKRGYIEGKNYDYITVAITDEKAKEELPILYIDDKIYNGKDALMQIRQLPHL